MVHWSEARPILGMRKVLQLQGSQSPNRSILPINQHRKSFLGAKTYRRQQEGKGFITLYSANKLVFGCEKVSSTCHVALHNDLAGRPKELNDSSRSLGRAMPDIASYFVGVKSLISMALRRLSSWHLSRGMFMGLHSWHAKSVSANQHLSCGHPYG